MVIKVDMKTETYVNKFFSQVFNYRHNINAYFNVINSGRDDETSEAVPLLQVDRHGDTTVREASY